jgi:hypothetical protein
MDERVRRIGENEILLRSVNERLEDVNQAFSPLSGKATFVCECGRRSCLDRIDVALEEYEKRRGGPGELAEAHDPRD